MPSLYKQPEGLPPLPLRCKVQDLSNNDLIEHFETALSYQENAFNYAQARAWKHRAKRCRVEIRFRMGFYTDAQK